MATVTVLVDSRGGNTRKVADAIAAELKTAAADLPAPVPAGTDLLFLGSGVYGGAPGMEMMKFVTDTALAGRKVAVFSTSGSPAGAAKMIATLTDGLVRKGAIVLGSWHCRGTMFVLFNRGHPDENDLDAARQFAQEMARRATGP